MSRGSTVLCLSASLLALTLAGLALIEGRARRVAPPPAPNRDLPEIRSLLGRLEHRVAALEARAGASRRSSPPRRAGEAASRPAPASAPAPGAALREQVEELAGRLATLEDDETIARRARAGQAQVARKEIHGALARVADPELPAGERLEAFQILRRSSKLQRGLLEDALRENDLEERDVVLPMLELAKDTTLEPELRAEVVRNLAGSKVEEIRQPLIDLLAFDAASEVREGAVDALMWQLEDPAVRSAIREAGQEDPDTAVRSRVERYLPKVAYFDRAAAAAEAPAAGARAPAGGAQTAGGK